MKTKISAVIIMVLFALAPGHAQNNRDSLAGFDETAALNSAVSEHLSASELTVKMFRLKRTYINAKYNLTPHIPAGNINTNTTARTEALSACLNEDFEQSPAGPITSVNQINGWTLTSGTNDPNITITANSCNLQGCCPNLPAQSALISAPNGFVDYPIGSVYPIYSVFGQGASNTLAAVTNTQLTQPMFGNKFIRLNNNINDYSIEKLSKTFMVTTGNTLFEFSYISAFTGGHLCCEAGAFQVKLTNATTGLALACPNLSVTTPTSADPANPTPGNCNASADTPDYFLAGTDQTYTLQSNPIPTYSRWKIHAIDLTAYIGQNITIDFIASDCALGGHYGYAYVDAQCGPMKLTVNGNTSIFNSTAINLSSCEALATITCPQGFSSYLWTGPNGSSTPGNILTTGVPGTYTLTLGQAGMCSVSRIINLNILTLTSTDSLLCTGNTATLTAGGLNSYLWNTGETNPSIVVQPANTFTFTVSGVAANGYVCATSFVQQVVGPCTGIVNTTLNNSTAYIYPNPNNGEFTLHVDKQVKNTELIIENTLGQQLFMQPVSHTETVIKTKNLAAGIYYYTIIQNNTPIAKGKIQIN